MELQIIITLQLDWRVFSIVKYSVYLLRSIFYKVLGIHYTEMLVIVGSIIA